MLRIKNKYTGKKWENIMTNILKKKSFIKHMTSLLEEIHMAIYLLKSWNLFVSENNFKGDKKIPTKQGGSLEQWNETKDHYEILLEEYVEVGRNDVNRASQYNG